MIYYKLRIDVLDELDVKVYRDLESKYFISFIRAYEEIEGHNKHFHYYIESMTKAPTIRNYIRTYIGRGNGVYSLGLLDEEKPMEYLSYIVKEEECVFYNISETLKEEILAYSRRVSAEIKEKRKKRKASDRTEVFKYLDEKIEVDLIKPDMVCELIVDWYIKEEKLLRYFYIKNLAETYLCRRNAHYRMQFVRKLKDDLTLL